MSISSSLVIWCADNGLDVLLGKPIRFIAAMFGVSVGNRFYDGEMIRDDTRPIQDFSYRVK